MIPRACLDCAREGSELIAARDLRIRDLEARLSSHDESHRSDVRLALASLEEERRVVRALEVRVETLVAELEAVRRERDEVGAQARALAAEVGALMRQRDEAQRLAATYAEAGAELQGLLDAREELARGPLGLGPGIVAGA